MSWFVLVLNCRDKVEIDNQGWYTKKVKNKKGKAVSLNLCFQIFLVKKSFKHKADKD